MRAAGSNFAARHGSPSHLHLTPAPKPPTPGSDRSSQRARHLVHLGELSAARQALVGSPLAPGSVETLQELRNPARRPKPLSREVLVFVRAATDLARAQVSPGIATAIGLGRIVALQSRVRGIVVSDFLRRLVARSLAQVFSPNLLSAVSVRPLHTCRHRSSCTHPPGRMMPPVNKATRSCQHSMHWVTPAPPSPRGAGDVFAYLDDIYVIDLLSQHLFRHARIEIHQGKIGTPPGSSREASANLAPLPRCGSVTQLCRPSHRGSLHLGFPVTILHMLLPSCKPHAPSRTRYPLAARPSVRMVAVSVLCFLALLSLSAVPATCGFARLCGGP